MGKYDGAEIGYDMGKQAAANAMAALFSTIDTVPDQARMPTTVMALGVLRFLIDGMIAWHMAHRPDGAEDMDIESDVEGIRNIMKEGDPDFTAKIAGFKEYKANQQPRW